MSLFDGEGDAGSTGNTGDTPPAGGSTGATGGVGNAPEWLNSIEGIDPALVNDPSLKAINNAADLVKSYVNAQKMIGKDKVIIPTEKSSATEWQQFWQKLGKPESADEYKFDLGEQKSFDDTFVGKFRELAHKHNILPSQAQALMQELNEFELSQDKNFQEELKARLEESKQNLQKEWGDAFQANVTRAANVVKEIGGQEMFDYVKQSGYGSDPKFVKFLVQISDAVMGEDKVVMGDSQSTGLSPDEIQKRINEAYTDKAYLDRGHPDHKRKVEEVQKLFVLKHRYETKDKQQLGF